MVQFAIVSTSQPQKHHHNARVVAAVCCLLHLYLRTTQSTATVPPSASQSTDNTAAFLIYIFNISASAMSHYKNNTSSNRDTLFGPPSGESNQRTGGPKHKRNAAANRDALFDAGKSKNSTTTSSSSAPTNTARSSKPLETGRGSTSTGYSYGGSTKGSSTSSGSGNPLCTNVLTGMAKIQKMKEAETYRQKAKEAMTRGVFSRPDPIMAGNYYKRAADAYQQCGNENRLERLHRIASADCQMGQGAYASAAQEYTRAADLAKDSDESTDRKRKEGTKMYSDAANAYHQMGDTGKAAKARVASAMAWLWEDDSNVMEQKPLTQLEIAIETYVPDVLNRYARYRQTGTSAYVDATATAAGAADPSAPPSKATIELAQHNLVKTAYAHEPLLQLVATLVKHREFASALYAAGGAAKILETDNIATLSLSRVYVVETILTLAMGDPVAAEQVFLEVHVQHTAYLSSRECKLAEDLFRAIKMRDGEALEEARSPSGSNRACLASLGGVFTELVTQLRLSGVARPKRNKEDGVPATATATAAAEKQKQQQQQQREEPEQTASADSLAATVATSIPVKEEKLEDLNSDVLSSEMDDLMNNMGLGSDDDEEDLSDDDIDLR